MNKKIIINNIGKIIFVEVILMLIPLVISIGYREFEDTVAFLSAIIPAGIISLLCIRVKEPNMQLSPRDGYIIVAFSWVLISLVGAIPMYASVSRRTLSNPIWSKLRPSFLCASHLRGA